MLEENPVISGEKKPGNQFNRYFAGVFEFVKIVVIAIIIVLPVRYFLFQPFIVKGESMVPNLHSGDYLIIDEISYRFKNPERGDVVVLKYPLDTNQRFIKRIIGLPGEIVQIKEGKVWISKDKGQLAILEEPYLPKIVTEGDDYQVLGQNQYYVLGDNRPYSYDSRGWGVLPEDNIIGRAALRLFPLSQFSIISDPSY